MRIQLPFCKSFELTGHWPSGSIAINGATSRNYFPLKLRHAGPIHSPRATDVNRRIPALAMETWRAPSHSEPAQVVTMPPEYAMAATTVTTDGADLRHVALELLSFNLQALDDWVVAAPVAERRERLALADKFAACWTNPALTEIAILAMGSLTTLPPIPPNVTRLCVCDCHNLRAPPDLSTCTELIHLDFAGCRSLAALPDLSQCAQLKTLGVQQCVEITEAPDLSACTKIIDLSFAGCTRLRTLPHLADRSALKVLDLSECHSLEISLNMSGCVQLTTILLSGCRGITALDFSSCDQLTTLGLARCTSLITLPPLGHLQRATYLNLSRTPLTGLPDDIVALPRHCDITLDASCLSDAVLNRLEHIMYAAAYAGPRIVYSISRSPVGTIIGPIN